MTEKTPETKQKKIGAMKAFGLAAGGLVLATGLTVGGAIAVNGIERSSATGVDAAGKTMTLNMTKISPVFESQTYGREGYLYWCWSLASFKCSIRAFPADKPTYDALKKELKARSPGP